MMIIYDINSRKKKKRLKWVWHKEILEPRGVNHTCPYFFLDAMPFFLFCFVYYFLSI